MPPVDIAIPESDHIAGATYDAERRELVIEFHSGGPYRYMDVPESVVAGFEGAISASAYFRSNVKGRYRYARM